MPSFPTVTPSGKRIPNPSRPLKSSVRTNTLVQGFDSGHTQRRQKSVPIQMWDLNYIALTEEQAKAISDFFLSCYGQVTSFSWEHPESHISFTCRFAQDILEKQSIGHNIKGPLYSMAFKLEQVL